jgi:hypothetical protein
MDTAEAYVAEMPSENGMDSGIAGDSETASGEDVHNESSIRSKRSTTAVSFRII